MEYKIITDSGCDLNNELKEEYKNDSVPLTISINDETFKDDEKVQSEIITLMESTNEPTRTACPSPNDFINRFKVSNNNEKIFVVTMSSNLSGSYNSAVTARDIFLEEYPNKEIYVIDSLNASAGETVLTHYIYELLKSSKYSASEVYNKALQKVKNINTIFVLQDISNLMKNGRLNRIAGTIVSMLNLKLVLGNNGLGEIELIKKARGTKKAFNILVQTIGENLVEDMTVVISHCNATEYAENIKSMLKERFSLNKIHIVETNGVNTVYANNGGIVVAY